MGVPRGVCGAGHSPAYGRVMSIRKGSKVTWSWGNGTAEGTVAEVHHDEVERQIKGEKIKRKGSKDDPAYLIEQEDGGKVLKLKSEVSAKNG